MLSVQARLSIATSAVLVVQVVLIHFYHMASRSEPSNSATSNRRPFAPSVPGEPAWGKPVEPPSAWEKRLSSVGVALADAQPAVASLTTMTDGQGAGWQQKSFANTARRDEFLRTNPGFHASGSVSVVRTPPPSAPAKFSSADLGPPSSESSTDLRITLESEIRAQLESQYRAEIDLAHSEQVTLVAANSRAEHALQQQVRQYRERTEALETERAEWESKQGEYPDNLSDAPRGGSVHSLAAPTVYPMGNKLNSVAIQADLLLSSCTDIQNVGTYGDPNTSGMLRSRLAKDYSHFAASGQNQQYFFHVLSILPTVVNKYLSEQANADSSLKNDPPRLIEFLCYRFSFGYIKSLESLRAVVPKTKADQPQFMTALIKVNFGGLFGPRLAKFYPAFFVQLGLLGEAHSPGLDFSALNPPSQAFTDAIFTVLSQKHFDFLRFKSELAFADKLASFISSGGVFSSGGSQALHAISAAASQGHQRSSERRSGADAGTRRDSARSSKPDTDEPEARMHSDRRSRFSGDRGGRGRRSSSRSRSGPSFRQFTFGPAQARMCHAFFETTSCNKRHLPEHNDMFQHWKQGRSSELDQAFAAWKLERAQFDENVSLQEDSSVPSDNEDVIPSSQ